MRLRNPLTARWLSSPRAWEMVAVACAYLASRIAFAAAGARYHLTLDFWQLLDQGQLTHRPLQAIWNLHAQPPAFNVLTALLLQVPGSWRPSLAQLLATGLGLVLVLSAYELTSALCRRRWPALAVLAFLLSSPAYALYEAWYFYTAATAAMVTFAALALLRFLESRRTAWGLLYSFTVGLTVLTNSTFQWPWLLLVLVPLGAALRADRRNLLKLCLLPLLVVGGWYLKNALMFHSYSTSSWVGMNLANTTVRRFDKPSLHRLVSQGYSPVILELPFAEHPLVAPRQVPTHRPTGEPTLDAAWNVQQNSKGDWVRTPNFNNLDYAEWSKVYLAQDLRFIQEHPGTYLHSVLQGAKLYLAPADQYSFFDAVGPYESNRAALNSYAKTYDRYVLLQLRYPFMGDPALPLYFGGPQSLAGVSLVNVATLLATLLAGVLLLVRRRLTPRRWAMAFAVVTTLYVFTLVNLVELGENVRFQMDVGPLPLIVSLTLLSAAMESPQGRKLWRWGAEALRGA